MIDDLNAKRMHECPARTGRGTCQIIDRDIGWVHGMPLPECDRCWSAGGRVGGETIRSEFVQVSVAGLKKRLPECKHEVVFGILSWHCTREEAIGLLTPEVQFALIRDLAWSEAQKSWIEADHFQRGTLKDFLKAVWSRFFDTPIDPATLAIRRRSCFAEPCPSLATARDGVRHYCSACGCGEKDMAMLDDPKGTGRYTKLEYPNLMCPRGRPGFSNAKLTVNGHPQ